MTEYVFAAIAGRPNAGKSSILNCLVGEKIAMVTEKPQTTRTRITGVLTEGELQYVFIDTPGLHKPHNKLGVHMNNAVAGAIADTDVIVFTADCTKAAGEGIKAALEAVSGKGIPLILALNKTDLLSSKQDLMPVIAEYSSLADFDAVIPLSAKENDGIDILKSEIRKYAKQGPHFFPDDKLTDQPEEILMAEMIREKVMLLMREEIPHGIAVGIDSLKEGETKAGEDILNIDATIYCEQQSHKGMVIGKGGSMLRRIGTLAREDLEGFFRIKVNLSLYVRVKEDWRNREGLIRSFGLTEE